MGDEQEEGQGRDRTRHGIAYWLETLPLCVCVCVCVCVLGLCELCVHERLFIVFIDWYSPA
jgi:hypothetical protein